MVSYITIGNIGTETISAAAVVSGDVGKSVLSLV